MHRDEFEIEVRQLRDTFERRRMEYLRQRDEIIAGNKVKLDEEVKRYDKDFAVLKAQKKCVVLSEEQKAQEEQYDEDHEGVDVEHLEDCVGVPDFWHVAIKNHAMLNSHFNERDAKIMKHLVRIQCSKS